MIIFNELEYAENLIEDGFENFVSYSDILILAKYYWYKGFETKQIEEKIIEFYKKYNPYYLKRMVDGMIRSATKRSKRHGLRLPIDIYVTQREVAQIRNLKNYKHEKICFVMLVVSRANKIAFKSSSPRYYVNQNFSEMMFMAKVRGNKKERDKIKHELRLKGMIIAPEPNKKAKDIGGEIYELLFIDESSDKEIIVNDMNDIIGFYPQKCIDCGKEMSIGWNRKRETCDKCYEIYRKASENKRVKKIYRQSKIK